MITKKITHTITLSPNDAAAILAKHFGKDAATVSWRITAWNPDPMERGPDQHCLSAVEVKYEEEIT